MSTYLLDRDVEERAEEEEKGRSGAGEWTQVTPDEAKDRV